MRHIIPPQGCAGGRPGRPGDIRINPGSAGEKRLPTRYADYPLRAGDSFRLDTPGGGGYGDPLTRQPERVLLDVRDGALSAEAAERDYGVVVTASNGAWKLDRQKTRALRAKLQEARLRGRNVSLSGDGA